MTPVLFPCDCVCLSFWGKFDLFEAAWQSSYDSYPRQQDCESKHSLVCQKQTSCSLSSHLSSALMRHHVADMSLINSLCVILIKKLIDQNESRNKTIWELPAALFWHDSIKGDITKLCSASEKIWAVHISHNSLKSKDSFVTVDFTFLHACNFFNK